LCIKGDGAVQQKKLKICLTKNIGPHEPPRTGRKGKRGKALRAASCLEVARNSAIFAPRHTRLAKASLYLYKQRNQLVPGRTTLFRQRPVGRRYSSPLREEILGNVSRRRQFVV